MADYDKRGFTSGKWAVKADLYNAGVKKCKIVSETNPEESGSFKNDDGSPVVQDVCKVQFEGQSEPLKVNLNRATINALIDAFGRQSSKWQGHELTVEIRKEQGKKYPMYLIPDGFAVEDDENGYPVVVPAKPEL